jgi:electron transport complex protein RnfG
MMKKFFGLGLTLAIFAGVACAGLAVVYQVTASQIDANQAAQLKESLQSLFSGAESFDDATKELSWTSAEVKLDGAYLVKAGGAVVGLAVKASGPSYGGNSSILVGITAGRKISGVRVLETKDTPGLGANAAVPTYFVDKSKKTTWPGQFAGKSLDENLTVKQDGGVVDAITASTITSRALAKIITTAAGSGSARLEAVLAGGN